MCFIDMKIHMFALNLNCELGDWVLHYLKTWYTYANQLVVLATSM